MTDPEHPAQDEDIKTPLSFKLMVVMVAVYLGWRLVQGVIWLVEKLF